jgi:hypothetical protein
MNEKNEKMSGGSGLIRVSLFLQITIPGIHRYECCGQKTENCCLNLEYHLNEWYLNLELPEHIGRRELLYHFQDNSVTDSLIVHEGESPIRNFPSQCLKSIQNFQSQCLK